MFIMNRISVGLQPNVYQLIYLADMKLLFLLYYHLALTFDQKFNNLQAADFSECLFSYRPHRDTQISRPTIR